ncbi:MAG: ABC transporter permease [Thermoproteota archaeon]
MFFRNIGMQKSRRSGWFEIWAAILHNGKALIGLSILMVFTAIAVLAPYIAPYDPFALVGPPYQPPSLKHILGTDNLGRDVLSQVIWGTRVSLFVGATVALAVTLIGVTVGLIAATSHRLIDEVLMRFCDVLIIIPKLPLTIFTAAVLGRGIFNIIIVLSAFGWPTMARIVRSEVLSVKQRAYVDAARMAGASQLRITFSIILPNVLPLVMANAILTIISGIMSEASLSFLGLGDPSQMSWGTVIYFANMGGAVYNGGWAWVTTPGLCIALVGMGVHLLGSAINIIANPRVRRY